jgi:hypothetical protein
MKLFIQIRNGQPFEHPILENNFREAFPTVDINNLPPEFARFERFQPPSLGVYEVYTTTYERVGDMYTDVHKIRLMSAEEKTAKQQETKTAWAAGPNFASWVFDEEQCAYISPIPYPKDGNAYRWDEPTVSWIEVNNV